MSWSLLSWLDASPVRFWSGAVLAFVLVVASALAAIPRQPTRRWWRHPALFGGLLLLCLLAFRWPILLDNRQLADPDESQLMAGAMTLRHEPLFWRSVDGTTHGPFAEWPLVLPLLAGGVMDYTMARTVSALLAWFALLSAWLLLRRLFDDGPARLLVLPLVATSVFTDFWNFVPYGSEHVPAALIAIGVGRLLTAWDRSGRAPRPWALFAAGLALGAVPFAKIQAVPPALWAAVGGAVFIVITPDASWRERGRALGALTLGGFTVPALLLVWIVTNGLWPEFWQCYILNNLQYAGGRWFSWAQTPGKFLELGGAADGFNPFFLWVTGFAAGALLLLPRFERWHRRCVLFALGLLLTAIYAAMAPGRMFMHYLQFVIFPAGLFASLVAGGAATAISLRPFARLPAAVARAAMLVLWLVGGLGPQIWWRTHRDYPGLGRFVQTQGRRIHTEVGREIHRHARPGESLGIWGWMPAFWVETGLIQATRDGNASREIDPYTDRDRYRDRFLADLRHSNPPVFIDAVGGDNFAYHDRATEGHETFPPLRDYIAANYRLLRDLDGTRIYVRNDRP